MSHIALALEGNTVDFTGFISALTGTVTPADILGILTSCVGIGVAFVLMWFGARKIMRAFQNAVMHGKFTA